MTAYRKLKTYSKALEHYEKIGCKGKTTLGEYFDGVGIPTDSLPEIKFFDCTNQCLNKMYLKTAIISAKRRVGITEHNFIIISAFIFSILACFNNIFLGISMLSMVVFCFLINNKKS